MDDPFLLFSLPRAFDLDRAALERAYLARSAAAHPDLAGSDSAPDSARLNHAAQTLRDPEKRAHALLALLARDAKPPIVFAPADDRALPDGFLAEMMDVRERMESDAAKPDAAAKWEEWGGDRRDERIQTVRSLFTRALSTPSPDPAALRAIKRELNAWRYIERMLEQLDA